MARCWECKDDLDDEFVALKISGRKRKLCEDCADRLREELEIAEASEGVIQDMMGYKGRR